MPFILPECSAFGLSEIKAYTDQHFKSFIKTDLLYLDHAFLKEFGNEFVKIVNNDFYSFYDFNKNHNLWVYDIDKSGLEVEYYSASIGDWVFRSLAFPEKEDNTEEYFNNFFKNNDTVYTLAMEIRSGARAFLQRQIEIFKLCEYDIIGFTSRFQQQVPAIALAKMIRQINPDIILFMGGPTCEFPAAPQLVTQVEALDFVFGTRYNLSKFGQWLSCYIHSDTNGMHEIAGIFSKQSVSLNNSDSIDPYALATDEDDINAYIIPDYQAYFQSLKTNDLEHVKPVLFFETSRGCPWAKCHFCGIDGYNKHHRKMTPDTALRYLSDMMQYADRCSYFIGTDSSMPYEYIKTVFPRLSIPDHVYILYETGVKLTEEEIGVLVENRVKLLLAGIESLITSTLKLLNKNADAFDNIIFLRNCRSMGAAVNWNLLTGIPGNHMDDLKLYGKIIPLLTHLYPPSGIWLISFQGPSDYVMHPQKHGIRLETYTKQLELIYPFDKKSLKDMAYFHFPEETSSGDNLLNFKIERCNEKIQNWKRMWSTENLDELPALYRKGNAVFDSRNGQKETILLDSIETYVLSCLNTPHRIEDFAKLRSEYTVEAMESAVNKLRQANLLFIEEDRMVSLVTKNPKAIR